MLIPRIGDTLRVELAPFGVRVITVSSSSSSHTFIDQNGHKIAAGCVETNIMKPETLPSDSIYQPIRDEYQSLRLEHFQGEKAASFEVSNSHSIADGAIPAQNFARIVADEALSQNPQAWLWTATHSWTTWFIHTFGGRRAFVSSGDYLHPFLILIAYPQDSLLSKMFGVNKLAERL